jgi:hypothetical protein
MILDGMSTFFTNLRNVATDSVLERRENSVNTKLSGCTKNLRARVRINQFICEYIYNKRDSEPSSRPANASS